MNTSLKFLFVLTAVAALSVAYPAKANLITNGGFETGDLTGWGGSDIDVAGTGFGIPPHSGNFQAGTQIPADFAILTQTLATTPGQSYMIDFWMAGVGENPGAVSLEFGGAQVFGYLFAGPTAYTEFTVNVTASNASSELIFDFILGIDSRILLDDISVNPTGVGVPDGGSTVSLLGCALLGLAALRRKLSC